MTSLSFSARLIRPLIKMNGRLTAWRFRETYRRLAELPEVPPQEGRFASGSVSLAELRWPGEGPDVVFVHGLHNHPLAWTRLASQLLPNANLFAPSMRGHGLSDAPAHGYRLADTDRDLVALLDHYGLREAVFVGESWGGKVVTHFAATHPERVRALVLLDPVLPMGFNPLISRFPSTMEAALSFERTHFATAEERDAFGRSLPYLPVWSELDARGWRERFVETPTGFVSTLPDAAYEELVTQALMPDIRELAARIRVPLLFLQPRASITFWPGELAALRELWPQMRHEVLPGDHLLPELNPVDVAQHLRTFLESLA